MMFCELVHGREYERASKPFLGLSPDFPQELQPETYKTNVKNQVNQPLFCRQNGWFKRRLTWGRCPGTQVSRFVSCLGMNLSFTNERHIYVNISWGEKSSLAVSFFLIYRNVFAVTNKSKPSYQLFVHQKLLKFVCFLLMWFLCSSSGHLLLV